MQSAPQRRRDLTQVSGLTGLFIVATVVLLIGIAVIGAFRRRITRIYTLQSPHVPAHMYHSSSFMGDPSLAHVPAAHVHAYPPYSTGIGPIYEDVEAEGEMSHQVQLPPYDAEAKPPDYRDMP
ncbi:hypothetical protein PsYK624_051040 [Phanerochaete sordida]|uniref:Uncharacterized protein n=1 Tax=Phanerochaete sordida TaxID=48140 RepID=A0A9P3G735_9APHY|nr:hypothetical protein PsYK624_051040 [Phanerochaete sordida]